MGKSWGGGSPRQAVQYHPGSARQAPSDREIDHPVLVFIFGHRPGTPKEVEETEAVTIVVPAWVWAFVALIPTTVMGLIAWHYKRRIESEEQARATAEKNREEFEFMVVQSTWAAIALSEATARAVQRIPDAKCNGDMKKALEYAGEVKHSQKNYLAKQGIRALY